MVFLLLLLIVLVISVTAFFKLAIKFGNPESTSTDVLDLDAIPRKVKEKEAILREDPEDLIV
ncbi:MAG: hypothetical protein AB8H12_00245 [Lewinella sp.]